MVQNTRIPNISPIPATFVCKLLGMVMTFMKRNPMTMLSPFPLLSGGIKLLLQLQDWNCRNWFIRMKFMDGGNLLLTCAVRSHAKLTMSEAIVWSSIIINMHLETDTLWFHFPWWLILACIYCTTSVLSYDIFHHCCIMNFNKEDIPDETYTSHLLWRKYWITSSKF